MERTQHIPSFIEAGKFVEARFKEISTLKNFINESNQVTSIFQRLPKHMRRRAMSHTVKRVPRKLRNAHERQLEKNQALQKVRRPRKYFRRRRKDLLLEYNRRQQTKIWLETHIWHAKRFHMTTQWGYQLPERSCDKSYRMNYRATSSHCLLQDISYYCCLEISGDLDILLNGLKQLTNAECGLSVGAKCWLSGTREGSVTLFCKNSYPYRVIGNVTFMWKPPDRCTSIRTLWIWCHPSARGHVQRELIDVFELQLRQSDIEEEKMDNDEVQRNSKHSSKSKKMSKGRNVEQIKLSAKKISSTKIPRYENSNSNICLLSLKDTLNRFRLTGPLSNAMLINALHPAESYEQFLGGNSWYKRKRDNGENIVTAFKLLEQYGRPSQFPPRVILGGQIVDPRLFLKRPKKKAVPTDQTFEQFEVLNACASNSAIWDMDVRNQTALGKFSNAKINDLRRNIIPGEDDYLLNTVNTVVPIMLIQQPGSSQHNVRLGYGSGWDLIVPANWGMPVWIPLIMCGAKPGALREQRTINLESKIMPELFPDSNAGETYYQDIKSKEQDRYFKQPPNKRANYIKNGFPTPFYYPWTVLTSEWSLHGDKKLFYILRDKRRLSAIQMYVENIKRSNDRTTTSDIFQTSANENCLIPVCVRMRGKGKLTPFSHVCVPTESDIRKLSQNASFSGPSEKSHIDQNRNTRRLLRQRHSKALKRLRRKRCKSSKAIKDLPRRLTKRKLSPTEGVVQEHLSAMKSLWLPETVTEIRNYCDREICGFILNSGFSFMESCVQGQGYVTVQSLSVLCDTWRRLKCDRILLTRCPTSLDYRFATLNVNI